jgi:hypothetical protein
LNSLSPLSHLQQYNDDVGTSNKNLRASKDSQRTPLSNKKQDNNKVNRSISGKRNQDKYNNGLHASPYSPGSILTKNPNEIENMMYQAPGIND